VDTILVHLFTAHQETALPGELLPTEILATVGHELRGPLTTIQGYAQTLLRHETQLAPTERQEFLRAISQASTHISLLVNRFLELAQFETHTHVFLPAPVNMRALAQEALTAAQEGQGHRLLLFPRSQTTRLAPDQEATDEDALTIEGDRRLLRWMLDLLLENALTYSAPESLVEVFLEPHTAAETTQALLPTARHRSALILPATFHEHEPLLEIRVQDHGRGIAPEELAAIFRRFYRRDTSLTREVNGLGLGLTLCQAIVALHRGMLWVESAPGEGSTFHLVLPRRQTLPDQDHEEKTDDLQHGKETQA
jgi:two-component system OmpR family sensor kinase